MFIIKKYKWNEPDPKKRDWDDSDYSGDQIIYTKWGRSDDLNYGNIDDLDPKKYNDDRMHCVSLGRGNNQYYGNIDDLDPDKYDYEQMRYKSLGRGKYNNNHQNLDRLDPNVHRNFNCLDKNILYKENPEYLI